MNKKQTAPNDSHTFDARLLDLIGPAEEKTSFYLDLVQLNLIFYRRAIAVPHHIPKKTIDCLMMHKLWKQRGH